MALDEDARQEFKPQKKKPSSDLEERRKKIVPGSLMKAVIRPGGGELTPSDGDQITEMFRSKKLANEKGFPVMKNVLLPKTKGFYACIECLRGFLDAVYDITIGYNDRCPTFLDNAFGVDPAKVHIHVHLVDITYIPSSEDQAILWLMETFRLKDQLLSDFHSKGHFQREGVEGKLSTLKCTLNFAFVIILTGLSIFKYY